MEGYYIRHSMSVTGNRTACKSGPRRPLDLAPPALHRCLGPVTDALCFLSITIHFVSGPSSRNLFDTKAILPFDNASTGTFDTSAWPAEPMPKSDAASVVPGKDTPLKMGALATAMVVGGGLLL
jgi:hypothetical protein